MRTGRALGLVVALLGLPVEGHAHPGARATERRLDQQPSPLRGADRLARAEARRELGDGLGAEEDLAAIAPGDVDPARIALERARIAAARGDLDDAEARFGTALELARPEGAIAPSRWVAQVLAERATLRTRSGDGEGARSDWDAAFAVSASADAALARGRLDEDAGDRVQAAAGYREALGITGSIALRRALVRVELARGAWESARQLADEAMASGTFDVEWQLLRAAAHEGAARPGEAERDRRAALVEAERAFSAKPTDLRRLALARALLANGREREARAAIEAVLRARPTLAEAKALDAEARTRAEGPRSGGRR
jgi:tetratricopeptide (TPR) repeat protein